MKSGRQEGEKRVKSGRQEGEKRRGEEREVGKRSVKNIFNVLLIPRLARRRQGLLSAICASVKER